MPSTHPEELAGAESDSAPVPDQRPRVLIVDDDPGMCGLLQSFLAVHGYAAAAVVDGEEAIQRFRTDTPAAVILDLVMPGAVDGLSVLGALKKIDRDVPVIVLSGHGRTATVVQAMKLGASDFVGKPFNELELEASLSHALRQRRLISEVAHLRHQLEAQSQHHVLLGGSELMWEVRDRIARVADTDLTVLIRGESGTGKELAARAIHGASARRDKPLIKVNCAALPVELLESELFGFERGAFSGAIQHKPGKFEFANQGTIFIDEIGELGASLQARMLRVLQDGELSRLGGKHDLRVDVRIIAATNCDLERAVAEGAFREDLFSRLNVVSIMLPPLRAHREDVPALTDYFLEKYSVQYNKPHLQMGADTMRLLVEHDWPGNVRELENLAKRFVVLGSHTDIRKDLRTASATLPRRSAGPATIRAVSLGASAASSRTAATIAAAAIEVGNWSLKKISRAAAREAERVLIARMLEQTRWNRKETAEMLGISYKALLYKIKDSKLDKAPNA